MPCLERRRAAALTEFGGLDFTVAGHTLLTPKAFAYRLAKDKAALTEAYVRLITKLEQLIKKGLTTAIYTELTDVEYEVNGYLTYDRAEWKVDVDTVKVCHQRLIKVGAGDLPDGI